MTHTFRHPKFFKELRKRNKRAQAISEGAATAADTRSTGPGLKQAIQETVPDIDIEEAKGSSSQARERASAQASSGARINKRWI